MKGVGFGPESASIRRYFDFFHINESRAMRVDVSPMFNRYSVQGSCP
jgi:hypothetical protein